LADTEIYVPHLGEKVTQVEKVKEDLRAENGKR